MPQRRRGGLESLTPNALHEALDTAILSQGNAELAILYLIDQYDFDLHVLRSKLREKGIDVSFSRITHSSISRFVGLDPVLALRDAPTFQLKRARTPTSLFKEIVQDMEVFIMQYGPPIDHANEKSRSRFLAPMFNRLVAQFKLLIVNTPESIMPSRIATKGRILYYFTVCGRVTIVFIEIKLQIGSAAERLDAIAQIIAESDACDYVNNHFNPGSSLIHGIFSDGTSFEFFTFDGSTKPPVFSRGLVPAPSNRNMNALYLAAFYGNTENYIYSLRPVCETIFYFLLRGYIVGLDAHYEQSSLEAQNEGLSRESTLTWVSSSDYAKEALTLATDAAGRAASGDINGANGVVEEAMSKLRTSVAIAPLILSA